MAPLALLVTDYLAAADKSIAAAEAATGPTAAAVPGPEAEEEVGPRIVEVVEGEPPPDGAVESARSEEAVRRAVDAARAAASVEWAGRLRAARADAAALEGRLPSRVPRL